MIRILMARSANARSSVKLTTFVILIPGAGLNSKRVITGPGTTVSTFPLTPKSSSFCSRSFDKNFKFSWSTAPIWTSISFKKSTVGSLIPVSNRMDSKTCCLGTGTERRGLGGSDSLMRISSSSCTFFNFLFPSLFLFLKGRVIFLVLSLISLTLTAASLFSIGFSSTFLFFRFSRTFEYVFFIRPPAKKLSFPKLRIVAATEMPVERIKPISREKDKMTIPPVQLEYLSKNPLIGSPSMPPAA